MDSPEVEVEGLEEKVRSQLEQLKLERAIFERLVYKNKNQHRRSSYFQYLLKVSDRTLAFFCFAHRFYNYFLKIINISFVFILIEGEEGLETTAIS